MKSLRKYTAAALSALLIASAMPFAASAAQADADSGTGEVIRGDVNGDGYVNSADITALYNFLLNGDDSDIVNGDQDKDGNITSGDVTFVYSILMGI